MVPNGKWTIGNIEKTKTEDDRDSLCGNLNVFDTQKLKLSGITKWVFLA